MERADAGLAGGILQIDLPVRMGVDPQRRFHRAAAVARRIRAGFARLAGHHLDKAAGQHLPISSRPMSLLPSAAACASSPSTISSGSGGTEPTCQAVRLSPIASTSSGADEERQAFVAADVVVGADVFVAGMADQHRPRHQFAELAAAVQAETALAHVGDRVTAMLLRERPVAGPGAAAEVGHGNGFALDERGRDHPANLVMAPWRRNGQLRGTIKDECGKGE